MIDFLCEILGNFFQFVRNLVRIIVQGVIKFFHHIVAWFKNMNLDRHKHKPFIANTEAFKEMMQQAPTKDVGIFRGVYNEDTDEIENGEVIEGDSLDPETKNTLGKEKLVLLT